MDAIITNYKHNFFAIGITGKDMKVEFETGTSYPVLSGIINGGYIININVDYIFGEDASELEFCDKFPFSKLNEMFSTEILENTNAEDRECIENGTVYRYEDCNALMYIVKYKAY